MRIPLDKSSSIPLYQQILNWIKQNILDNSLPGGYCLPSSRELAKTLGVSRITVMNAYGVLESEGLLITREGSGTFVAELANYPEKNHPFPENGWPRWQSTGIKENNIPYPPSTLSIAHPHPILFTGVGDARLFPLKEFENILKKTLRRDGFQALEYGILNQGVLPLRETLAHILTSQGIHTHPKNILITSGSQQALALVVQTLLRSGDSVLVEQPTYNFALTLFRAFGLKPIGIPIDENGMLVDELEQILHKHQPKLIYTIPNFQNPSGVSLSTARRHTLLSFAKQVQIPILEDDFVGDLRYEGRTHPAIKALDHSGNVIYIGTFSKMLFPGLRVGYLIANGPVFESLVNQKIANDLTTSPLMQRALELFVSIGRYQAHLRRTTRIYRKRRDVMVESLRALLPGCQFSIPQGGLFIWLKLPDGVSSTQLLTIAHKNGVDFAPGTRFFPNHQDGEAYLRLNFTTCTPEEITRGVQRLKTSIEEMLPYK